MQADGVARRNNGAGDDVVAVDQRAGDGLTDAIDVHGGSGDEGNNKTNSSCKKSRDHKSPKPTHIETIVGGGDPFTK